MKTDLEQLYKELAAKVSTEESDKFIFSRKTLAAPPEQLSASALAIVKSQHVYNTSYRVDRLEFFADKITYRCLGLLILSTVFWPVPNKVHLRVENKLSDVKNFMIEYVHSSEDKITPGYHTQPFAFSYWPGQASKHPWVHLNLDRFDLPELRLTNLDDCLIQEEDWERRDTVWSMGSGKGSVLFAELLLNISRPEAKLDEFHLECEAGFRGVASLSAEISLWLPGSFGWRPVA